MKHEARRFEKYQSTALLRMLPANRFDRNERKNRPSMADADIVTEVPLK